MRKTILLCGNGLSGESIRSIKSWGYRVLLISEFPFDVGISDADAFVEANSKNAVESVEAAETLWQAGNKFDGVISLCWDSARSVAAIADRFGLKGISLDSANRSTDKVLRSHAFLAAGVPSPRFAVCETIDDVRHFASETGFPFIVKPRDLSSSKGVTLVEDEGMLSYAYDHARRYSPDDVIVLNEFIAGTEHSTEGLMLDGVLHLTAISDRLFRYEESKPHFVEIGDVMPSTLGPALQGQLSDVTQRAALSLGITDGVVKGDIIIDPKRGPLVLELAGRLGGPRFGTEMVPLSNGTCLLKAVIQQALGEDIDLELLRPKYQRGMVNRSLFPEPGEIIAVEGLDKIDKMPGYYDFKWWHKPLQVGDAIKPYRNSCGDVAYLITEGHDRNEALKNADAIERSIIINTKPFLPS